MFHPYQQWIDNPDFTYLGSEKNPATGMEYDYWLVHGGRTDDIEHGYSFICRHGMDAPDYGSGPLCVAHYDTTHYNSRRNDFIFGIERAKIIALYYLATKKTPLIQPEETPSFGPMGGTDPWSGLPGDGF